MDALSQDQFMKFRGLFLKLVLSTDNSLHFPHIKKLQQIIESEGSFTEGDNQSVILINVFHAADIANQCRPFHLAADWGRRIVCEFFDQGDKERLLDLPITPGCDRHSSNFEQS